MGRFNKSMLSSEIINKCVLNKKDYRSGDFKLKCINPKNMNTWIGTSYTFRISHFKELIFECNYTYTKSEKKIYDLRVNYFNPQTDSDCITLNHVIATLSQLLLSRYQYIDYGNIDVFNNRYVFRRKDNYYSFVKVWDRGKIEENWNKDLSFEFSLKEFISQTKNIYGFSRIQRRKLMEQTKLVFRDYIDKEEMKQVIKNLSVKE